ncbi:glycosyltransferase family 2 protein [Fulvivirga maritima]|uniref:glycosyltransferase n=1 Tax=Fulvivirga maritima TaxID=2904247 RepID=UPI001F373B10|nr:glycosyltransferase family 2 protein [Fulvivirga maritima]UII25520.1 glycosyltransferase family 2 protein [Fulvivirga maritima]
MFGYAAVYSFFFSSAGLFYRAPKLSKAEKNNRFAVLIPGYKEDGVIVQVAKEALKQTYDNNYYDVVIIADSFKDETLAALRKLPIKVIEVSFEKSTKVKALNKAMEILGDEYDNAIILDADNIMSENFIEGANFLHQQGHKAIQGRRAAKNQNNTLSYLDGLSEEINNHVFCKGSTALGLSSSLKGSGMSFDYQLVKTHLAKMSSIGGFDRDLEVQLIRNGIKVKYASNIIVLDEKVEKPEVFENQRKRWISSQFYYLKRYFGSGFASMFSGNLTHFNSAILRNIQLPRLINLGLTTILFATALVLYLFDLPVHIYLWSAIFFTLAASIVMAIPRSYYTKSLLISIISLPVIFWKMLLILFKLKGANKKFIHTPHTS